MFIVVKFTGKKKKAVYYPQPFLTETTESGEIAIPQLQRSMPQAVHNNDETKTLQSLKLFKALP